MNDEEAYSPDEPVATGGVRTELRGNIQAAQGLVRSARRLLGQMRTIHGVNARIAEGEPGGFYTQTRQLDDGSYLEVITNDGQDTIRITCPTQPTARSSAAAPVQSAHASDSTPSSHAHAEAADIYSEALDQPPPKPEEEEEETIRRADYDPYLWVGVRIVAGPTDEEGNFTNQLHACIWEPPHQEGDEPVILSNRNEVADETESEAVYPLQRWKQFTEADTAAHRVAYTDDKLYMLIKENGYPMTVPDAKPDDTDEFKVVFISDPDNDMELMTPDGPMTGSTNGGTYYVKVMAIGPDCGPDRIGNLECEVRVITGKGEHRTDNKHRFNITAFTSYRMGIFPKGWFEEHEPFDSSDCDDCETAVPDHGHNPHGPHWWQGAATIELAPAQAQVRLNEVQTSTTEFSDELTLPPTGFAPGSWFSNADLCPACEYVDTRYWYFGVEIINGWYYTDDNGACPDCGDTYITFYLKHEDRLNFGTDPNHDLANLNGAVFTGEFSGASVYVQFLHEEGINPPYYTTIREVPYVASVWTGNCLLWICLNEETEFHRNFSDITGAEPLAMFLRSILGAPWPGGHPPEGAPWGEGVWAFFKRTTRTDRDGNVTTDPTVQISKAEFDALPVIYGTNDKYVSECRRSGADED